MHNDSVGRSVEEQLRKLRPAIFGYGRECVKFAPRNASLAKDPQTERWKNITASEVPNHGRYNQWPVLPLIS
jgi:hypothetical protein